MGGRSSGVLNIHRGPLKEMTFPAHPNAEPLAATCMEEAFYRPAELFNTA
jgi:hypothetical protein